MRGESEMNPARRQRLVYSGVALASLLVGAAIWLHAAGPRAGAGYDFGAYVSGARAVAAGQNPYHALINQAGDLTAGDTGFHAHGYVYPPLLALILSIPLRLGMDARGLWLLWMALNAAAVVWMGRELQRYLLVSPPGKARDGEMKREDPIVDLRDQPSKRAPLSLWAGVEQGATALAFAAACVLPAVVTYDLSLGQADLLMAALAVGAFGLWSRGNPWAALVIALAIAVKPTLALVLAVWLWKGDWRGALRGAVATVVLLALSFVPVGLAALHDYLVFYSKWNAFQANAEYINQSPYGMLLRMFTLNAYTHPLINAPWLVLPLRLASMAGAAWLWARAVSSPLNPFPGRVGKGKLSSDALFHWVSTVLRPRFRRGDGMPRPLASTSTQTFCEQLLALPLILLLSPLAEDIHFCLLVPALVGLGYLAWRRGMARTGAAWALWIAFAVSCIPRMQELIYPDRFFGPLPGQHDPHIGAFITLARTGTLLYLAIVTLTAGGAVLRANSIWAATTASEQPSLGKDERLARV